jgi:ribosomal protein S18 acetylase RimI-like enzyme
MTTTPIKSANESNSQHAIAVILLAFATDPLSRWIYSDPHQYLRHFPGVITIFGANAFEQGSCYYVDAFAGVALWLPPNVHASDDEMGKLLQQTVPKENQEDVFAVLEQMGNYHPIEPHWYLPMIGVDPSQQGKGYGSALMQHALVQCDREKKPAYLETANPRNVPLYERLGFEVLATIQIGSSPPVFPMLRRPRAL